MFSETVIKLIFFLNNVFGFEELNGDEYPKNYIEITNKNGKKEVIQY